MRSVSADKLLKAGRPRVWVAGLVLCAVVVTTVVLVVANRPQTAVLPSAHRTHASGGPASRAAAATGLLSELTARLGHGTERQVVGLAAPGDRAARGELADIFHNVRAAGIDHLSMRYVDEQTDRLDPTQLHRFGDRAWVADVQLGWRVGGYDRATSRREITLTLTKTPRGAAFVSARPDFGDPAPLWLLGRLDVLKGPRSMVMVGVPGQTARFAHLADRAVVTVRKVLHGWRGKLVVEVPDSQNQLDRTLGASPNAYDQIAAVTTTADGSRAPSAPVHIFVNPPIFDPLGPNGSQIVMSHEATHVATHAATSTMPTWLLEGFADFVALDHVNLPVSVTASQILGDVRKHGVPGHLPGVKEFNSANTQLGASYESAWLACRLIGATYGERKLIAFYRESKADSSTTRAFHDVLGTNQAAFTRAWRAYLRQLA